MTKTSTAAIKSFIPELGILVPYLSDDEAHFWEVLEGEIERTFCPSVGNRFGGALLLRCWKPEF